MSDKPAKARRGRHEGGVTKLPSGSYRVTISLGKDRDGKRVRESVTAPTKGEALEAARRRMAELGPSGAGAAERGLTFGQWFVRWWSECQSHLSGSPARSRRNVRARNIDGRPLADLPLARVRPSDVRAWLTRLEEEGRPASVRALALKMVKAALAEAVRRELIRSSPADKVKGPRQPRREKRSLTAEQARALQAAAAGTPLELYVALGLDSGCRPGELLALRRGDVLSDGRTLDVRRSRELETGEERQTKTKAGRRRVLLSGRSARLIAALPPAEPDAPLIARPGGRHDYFLWLFHPLKKLAAAAGVPWAGPYTLRHTMASLMLADGVPIAAVAERLGHSSPAVTLLHYAHSLPTGQQRAAEAADRLFG